jgi:hypothetical protein
MFPGLRHGGRAAAALAIAAAMVGGGTFTASAAASRLPDAALVRAAGKHRTEGTVNIVNRIIPHAQHGLTPSSPGVGWTFTASSSSSVVDHVGVTDETGAVSFRKTTPGAPASLRFTETPPAGDSGFSLVQQDGANATCTSSTGRRVAVANVHADGFTVETEPDEVLTCTVYDRAPEPPPDPPTVSVIVNETWDINGVVAANGDQDPDFRADISLTPPVTSPPGGFHPNWGQQFGGYREGQTVTIDEDHVRIPEGCRRVTTGAIGQYVLAEGVNAFDVMNTVRCKAHLTLIKEIRNPFPGAHLAPLTSWTLTARTAAGQPPVIVGTTGMTGVILSGVRYVLAESFVPGYRQQVDPDTSLVQGASGSWRCVQVVDGGPDKEALAGGDGTVTAAPGQSIQCTATNIPQPARLTLVKQVRNIHGGTARPSDWTLTATPEKPPAPELTGTTGVRGPINPGEPYRLTEQGPSGYQLTSLTCVTTRPHAPVPLHGDTLTAEAGQKITCTFVNTQEKVRQRATLTLVKQVINGPSGTARPGDWTLTAKPEQESGTASPVLAGKTGIRGPIGSDVPYALTEHGPQGYLLTQLFCVVTHTGTRVPLRGVILVARPGEHVTCTYVNAQQAVLTLVKQVVNDHGGHAAPADWTLIGRPVEQAEPPAPVVVGKTGIRRPVAPGVRYALSEQGPSGYRLAQLFCVVTHTHHRVPVLGRSITASPGEHVTCTFVNTQLPPMVPVTG